MTASTAAQRKFCRDSKISMSYLRALAKNGRSASAVVARRVEKAAQKAKIPLQREDLCPACRICELAKAARKLSSDR